MGSMTFLTWGTKDNSPVPPVVQGLVSQKAIELAMALITGFAPTELGCLPFKKKLGAGEWKI